MITLSTLQLCFVKFGTSKPAVNQGKGYCAKLASKWVNITKIICLLDMGTKVAEMGRDGDRMGGYGNDFCPGAVAL